MADVINVSINNSGVPSGGTPGQLLGKKSGLSYDLEWLNAGSSTAQTLSLGGAGNRELSISGGNTVTLPVGNNSVITNFSLTGNILTLELDNASPVTVDLSTIGITTAQSNAIVANTAKTGITVTQANEILANNGKVGITVGQASAIVANTSKVGITTAQSNAITTNTAKVGITQAEINKLVNVPTNTNTEKQNTLVSGTSIRTINGQTLLGSGNIDVSGGGGGTIYSEGTGLTLTNSTVFSLAQTVEDRIALNDAKTGITVGQASDITANNSKVGITTGQASAIVANTNKVGITTAQSNAIVANTNKVGITAQQSTDITTNNSKTGITTAQSNAIVANTAKTGITAGQASAIVANTAKVGIPTGGTTNQVLAKTSATDFDTAWVTPSAGGGVTSVATGQPTGFQTANNIGLITEANLLAGTPVEGTIYLIEQV
jgi:hypothetical protein